MEIRAVGLVPDALSDRSLLEVHAYAKRSASGWCDGDRQPGRPVPVGGLIELYCGSLRLDRTDLGPAVERTEGVTASFLKELLRRAALMRAERRRRHHSHQRGCRGRPGPTARRAQPSHPGPARRIGRNHSDVRLGPQQDLVAGIGG